MKKLLKALTAMGLMFCCFTQICASDSASNSGYGYTLYGSISDSYLSGSVSGSNASSVTVKVSGYVLNTSGSKIYTGRCSGSPYVNCYKGVVSNAVKWISGNVYAYSGSTMILSTGTLYN